MRRVVSHGWGPERLLNAVTSTGPGTAVDADPSHSDWGLQVVTAGSTSAITCSVTLQGTLDMLSTAPTYMTLLTWSSTGESSGDIVFQASRPAGKVRANVVALTSTSSTAPTASAYVGGA
jgi:hypothetical protein